jgi:murein DD-endopeptidase MepM/ murein hydrolase activator NlpD
MGDQKLVTIIAGVFALTFLPIVIVIALILGSIGGLDDESECPPNGSFPGGAQGASFGYPVDADYRNVKAAYVAGDDEDDPPRHPGVDFDVPADKPVRAAADGEVIEATGSTIKIKHAENFQTWYLHLSDVTVDPNERVSRNQEIGKTGSHEESSPGATGAHLHFEIHVDAPSLDEPGIAVDPMELLREEPGSSAGAPTRSSSAGAPTRTSSAGGSDDGPAPSMQELSPYAITMEQLDMRLTETQLGYVDTIIGVGKAENLPPRAWVIALAVVAVESGFDPNACCDHSSVGLFQQLDAWGSHEDRMDPATSARMFYRGDGVNGLRPTMAEFPNWETEQLWLIAGEAQEPDTCYPPGCQDLRLKYGKWERFAINLVLAHYGAAPIPGGGAGCESGGGGGPAIGDYAFPLEHDSIADTNWLTKPHHDYPAADIPVPTGTKAYAITSGRVTYVGGACGTGLVITTTDGIEYVYCHGESRSVADGAQVGPGDLVMITNNTGRSSGPHLHFGVRTADGVQRCPQNMLINLYNGEQPPDPQGLPSSGCSY